MNTHTASTQARQIQMAQAGYALQESAPQATVGTEIDRAQSQASECSRLALEIAIRVLGPAPTNGDKTQQPMPPHIRGRIANVADLDGRTASMLQSILDAL